MRSIIWYIFAIIAILIVTVVGFLAILAGPAGRAEAVQLPKVYWCHCEPNGNCQTLYLSQNALEQAGHVNANGNPLHAGDHAGACVEPTSTPRCTPTPTIYQGNTPTPTVYQQPTPTDTPTPTQKPECEGEFCPVEIPVPTPTVEVPKPTESPKEEHHDNFNVTNTAVSHPNLCTGSAPAAPIATGGQRINSQSISVRWFRSTDSVNHYVLEYGPDKDHLIYGVPWISPESDHFEINGVTSAHWFYRITAEGDNFCQSSSEVSDP